MAKTQTWRSRPRSTWVILAAGTVAVVLRLPLLHLPAWPDEAGFLSVADAWHLGGSHATSLYGSYWVDRPPVLITVFGLASRLGGLVALRLLGALAALVAIVGVASVARSVAGPRAAAWAAVTAAALLSTPFHWSFMVDGELVAAPFVAAGIALVVRGLAGTGRRALLLTAAGGAMAGAALLTKQNMADVFVFTGALVTMGLLSRSLAPGAALRHSGSFAGGVLALVAVTAVWTKAHGTSLGAVFYAMYAFRLDAAAAAATDAGFDWGRLASMGAAALLSGLAVLTVWVLVSGLRRGHRDIHVLALLVVLVFDLVSVASGTNYWLHYLVQPVVPVAALTGILAARGSLVRVWGVVAAVAALAAWAVLLVSPPQTGEELVGTAIAGSSSPGDTIVSIPGHANVNYAAGLRSPYPYLWATPARTLDPGEVKLKRLLGGPRAPTWLVSTRAVRPSGKQGAVGTAIADHYREVRRICGREVYLHDDVRRPALVARPLPAASRASRCQSTALLPRLLREVTGTASS